MSHIAYNPAYALPPIISSQCGGAEEYTYSGGLKVQGFEVFAQNVIPLDSLRQQLRMMPNVGSVEWLTHSEIQDAVQGAIIDGTVSDDHEGHNYRDRLSVTWEEKLQRERARKRSIHPPGEPECEHSTLCGSLF